MNRTLTWVEADHPEEYWVAAMYIAAYGNQLNWFTAIAANGTLLNQRKLALNWVVV